MTACAKKINGEMFSRRGLDERQPPIGAGPTLELLNDVIEVLFQPLVRCHQGRDVVLGLTGEAVRVVDASLVQHAVKLQHRIGKCTRAMSETGVLKLNSFWFMKGIILCNKAKKNDDRKLL